MQPDCYILKELKRPGGNVTLNLAKRNLQEKESFHHTAYYTVIMGKGATIIFCNQRGRKSFTAHLNLPHERV